MNSGLCTVCNNTLSPVKISITEFNIVKKAFMKKVVKERFISHKIEPDKWQMFEAWIHENGPFDIIIDGLNVGINLGSKGVTHHSAREKS